MYDNIKTGVKSFGIPRVIIVGFFLLLVVLAGGLGMNLPQLLSDVLKRWGMFGILALAMVPAVQCGIGLNFGISLGIVGGLLGGVIVIEFHITEIIYNFLLGATFFQSHEGGALLVAQWGGILVAIAIGMILSAGIGYLYGQVLNRVKGSEMTVTTYIGFSIIAFMNIIWSILPLSNGDLIWPNAGKGLRNTISLESSFTQVMNNTFIWEAKFADFVLPTGLIAFFLLTCFAVWLFMRSKTGIAMSAVGSNPKFAQASGIGVNKMRIIGTMLSTVLAAVGILVYAQGFGFMQLYNGPMMMGFNSVAAVLIGGATIKHARISHVLIGTFLFQGIMTLALPVANQLLPGSSLSEVMRLIISNGIIIYALTQGGASRD